MLMAGAAVIQRQAVQQPLAPDTGERGWCGAEVALYRSPVQVKHSVIRNIK